VVSSAKVAMLGLSLGKCSHDMQNCFETTLECDRCTD